MTIGEVLVALRPDFADMTISKIRFLDGAGLVSPRRSGSGYRRFSDADVRRLRQVLTLQRDHYLPLKVIRAHIVAGTLDQAATETVPPAGAAMPDPGPSDPRSPGPARVRGSSPPPDSPSSIAPGALPVAPVPVAQVPVARVAAVRTTAVRTTAAPNPAKHDASPARQDVGPARHEGPPPPRAVRSAGTGSAPARRLRIEDLLRGSGLSIETLTELEKAGLLRSRNGWYHPEDLAVAVAAAQLAAHGIGSRHLRSLRNGADRELGLLEQSLVPVLRRARPDARLRAQETADALRELYGQVHAALVTAGLRDLGVDPG